MMKFGEIKQGFECAGMIGECYMKLNDLAEKQLLDFQKEKNNHAEFVKAKFIKSGVLTEEMTNQEVPYVCKYCNEKSCQFLTSSILFSICPNKKKNLFEREVGM